MAAILKSSPEDGEPFDVFINSSKHALEQ